MKILLVIIVIAGIVGLLFFLLRNVATSESLVTAKKTPQESLASPMQTSNETLVTLEQIPAVVAKLQHEGKDSSFAVFMFVPKTGEPNGVPVNLQYSIENGVTGLDWVLLSPRNIADRKALSTFITNSGYKFSELEANDVKYLRVEGSNISELGVKICREFYRLSSSEKIELLAEGFEW
jgi:hypothetical protein